MRDRPAVATASASETWGIDGWERKWLEVSLVHRTEENPIKRQDLVLDKGGDCQNNRVSSAYEAVSCGRSLLLICFLVVRLKTCSLTVLFGRILNT